MFNALAILNAFAILGALIWFGVYFMPFKAWRYRENLDSDPKDEDTDLSRVTVLTPARNEEAEIGTTFSALRTQGSGFQAILVDDQSTDQTQAVARAALPSIKIIDGTQLPSGWTGKLWALEQGRKHVTTPLILLMDADIRLEPGILKSLIAHQQKHELSFVSLMAFLRMQSFWEKLLIPAYIYFFKLLYPFALGNNPRFKKFAVAAGGCILIETEVLDKLGGFAALHDALIDDCTLAKKVKAAGYKTWMGTTHSVTSHRAYDSLNEIWNLVARFAFTYLRYNWILLGVCTILMFAAYWAIPLALIFSDLPQKWTNFLWLGYALLFICYYPTVRFYRLNPLWTFLHPFAGTLYMAMTWSSAFRYASGRRSEWKGRTYDQNLVATEAPAKHKKSA